LKRATLLQAAPAAPVFAGPQPVTSAAVLRRTWRGGRSRRGRA